MNTAQKYKYIVAEDEPLIRRNIIKKIDSLHLPLELAGQADNALAAKELIQTQHPSIVLTDICMPGSDGLQLSKFVYQQFPKTRMVIVSGYSDFDFAQKAIRYHVFDYLLKPVTAQALNLTLQNLLIVLDAENQALSDLSMDPHGLSQEEISNLMIQYLSKNYQSDVSIGDLARKMGYTNEYLSKIFKKHTGTTPSKYLIGIRLNKAKYLLVNRPDLEVRQVGEQVGYADAFYFSRLFKERVGMHPSDYRLENRAITPL